MRMRLLVCVTTILLAGAAWAQNMCNPVCANQPKECCQADQGGLLGFECSGHVQPHFILSDGDAFTEVSGLNASFSVAGLTVHTTIGNTTFAPFTIGSSETRVRFTTSNGGECVQVSNLKGFVNPSPIVVDGRALTILKTGSFFCREPQRDLICFPVKGQVGPPFPALACNPDRVEYACGIVK